MSVLEAKPQEYVCGSSLPTGPEELLVTARKVWLGKTTLVARALPDRAIRMIGAWCFLDHYGPEDVSDAPGMQVPAHPHTGLQTVSWLVEGEVEHRDSLGTQAMVTPGTLNIMTAGHGIVHSEMSRPDKPPTLHGLQLWVALPDDVRDSAPRFDRYTDLPIIDRPGVRGQVLIGEIDGVRSPAISFSPLVGADLILDPGVTVELATDPDHEHGVFVVSGRGGDRWRCRGDDRPADLSRYGSGRRDAGGRRRRGEGAAAGWRAVRRGDRDVVELHRPYARGGRRVPRAVGAARGRGGNRALPTRDHSRRAGDGGTGDADRPLEATSPQTTRATGSDG